MNSVERGNGVPRPTRPPEAPSLGDLLSKLALETNTLVRQEITLLGKEASEKASVAVRQLVFVSGGLVFAGAALIVLAFAAVFALSLVVSMWLAALIVGGSLGLIAFAVIQKGISALRQIDPKPTATIQTLQENKSWAQALVR